jgi:hypothetical protein
MKNVPQPKNGGTKTRNSGFGSGLPGDKVLELYPAYHAEKYADGEKFTRAIEEMPQNSTVEEIEGKILKFVSGIDLAK